MQTGAHRVEVQNEATVISQPSGTDGTKAAWLTPNLDRDYSRWLQMEALIHQALFAMKLHPTW